MSSNKSLWLLLPFILLSAESKSVCRYPSSVCGPVHIDPHDRNVLMEFKSQVYAINYPSFYDDWKESLTCDKGWIGICTDKNGRVTEMDLYQYDLGLDGVIPKSFGNLTKLLYVDMSYTFFSSLPSTIGLLSELRHLGIRAPITTLPPSLASLSKLTYLGLTGYQLNQSVLPLLSKLTSLTNLSLSENQFTTFPLGGLSSLTKLIHLDMSDNYGLKYTPIPTFNTLTSLQYLDLSFCGLTGNIPASYASFKNLTTLDLSVNHLCGSVPSYLETLTKLNELYLPDNFFTGSIPPKLALKFCSKEWFSGFDDTCIIGPKTCYIYPRASYKCAIGCNQVPGVANDIGYAYLKMSTTYWYGYPDAARDGSSGNGIFSSRSCAHTQNQTNPWIHFYFEIPHHVTTVQLYNRLDCCSDRLNGVQVYLGNSGSAYNAPGNVACTDPKFKYGPSSKGFPINVTCNRNGSHIWVVIPGKKKILTLCEVVIFGK